MTTQAERQKAYRERLKLKAKEGDQKAIQQIQRDRNSRRYSSVKSFIKKHANLEQLNKIEKLIKERKRQLIK